MKISIITVCLNSEKTIEKTFNSVLTQTYKNIEHIIVDGGSLDNTKYLIRLYPNKKKKIFFKKNLKLYASLNFAIKQCNGDYIIILHSDDIFNNPFILEKIVNYLKKSNTDILLASTVYFDGYNENINRHFSATNFNISNFNLGLMPPHTSSIIKTEVYKKNLFNEKYKIAGDFDFFYRIFKKNYSRKIINKILIRMQSGGISNKNIFSYLRSSIEIIDSLKLKKLSLNSIIVFFRFLFKFSQLFILNKKFYNIHFKEKINKFYSSRLKYDFFIYNKINKILKKNKFILSAMNLAFLGSYINNPSLRFFNLIHWPDGISVKLLGFKIKKIPGRKLLEDLKLNKTIKRIIVIGNLSKISNNALKTKFKKKVINYNVPYGSSELIAQKLKYTPKKNDLIFITLPTPKQEELAIKIAKKSLNYRIICIGGSIAIFSGDELAVPEFLKNYEFVWRLQFETKRRIGRLLLTFKNVLYDLIFVGLIRKLRIKYIK